MHLEDAFDAGMVGQRHGGRGSGLFLLQHATRRCGRSHRGRATGEQLVQCRRQIPLPGSLQGVTQAVLVIYGAAVAQGPALIQHKNFRGRGGSEGGPQFPLRVEKVTAHKRHIAWLVFLRRIDKDEGHPPRRVVLLQAGQHRGILAAERAGGVGERQDRPGATCHKLHEPNRAALTVPAGHIRDQPADASLRRG